MQETLAITFHVCRRIRGCVVVMEINIDVECEGRWMRFGQTF